jgi:integrase
MIIDSADVISLEQAREEWKKHRAIVKAGGDPVQARKLAKLKKKGDDMQTFGSVSREWLERNKGTWSGSHYRRNQSLLDRVLLPTLGALPIGQIELGEVLVALRKVEERSPLSARKAKTVAAKVFDYAVGSGRAKENPARKIVGEQLKAKPEVTHRKALTMDQLAVALRNMKTSSAREVTKAAVMMLLYTALRDFALRGARWQEIDLANALWTVPAARMKGTKAKKREHVVPLPRQAVELLRELAKTTDRGPESFVFVGQASRANCLSEKTLTSALRSFSGVDDVHAHGVRTMLMDFAHENSFPSEVVELQLAHQLGSVSRIRGEAVANVDPGVRKAYLSTPLLDLRAKLIQAWADTLSAMQAGKPLPQFEVGNIVRTRKRGA